MRGKPSPFKGLNPAGALAEVSTGSGGMLLSDYDGTTDSGAESICKPPASVAEIFITFAMR